MARTINQDFIDALNDRKKLLLYYFKERVEKDYTLILCFRNDDINIYYNGGSLLDIHQDPNSNNYTCTFNLNYAKHLDKNIQNEYIDILNENTTLTSNGNTISGSITKDNNYVFYVKDGYKLTKGKANNIIDTLKKIMDSYIDSEQIESIAQLRLFADNFNTNFKDGYILLDIKYIVTKSDCPKLSNESVKIDGIALKIEQHKMINITLVAVKSKFDACNGTTAGLANDKNDYLRILKIKQIKTQIRDDVKFALETYQKLGLLDKNINPDDIDDLKIEYEGFIGFINSINLDVNDDDDIKIDGDFDILFVFSDEISNETVLRAELSSSPLDLKAFDKLCDIEHNYDIEHRYKANRTKFISKTLDRIYY